MFLPSGGGHLTKMASLFPNEQEARAFADARALLEWAGLSQEIQSAFEKKAGSLGNRIRNLALLTEAMLVQAVKAMESEGGPTLVEKAQIGLAWRVARRLAAASWGEFIDKDPFEEKSSESAPRPAGSPTSQQQATTSGDGAASLTTLKKVKLSQVLDQADDTEVSIATDSTVRTWYANWQTFAQGPPDPEEEPSVEQLTALHTRVAVLGKTPWADFAVFSPFAKRVLKANKFKTFLMQADGTFVQKELPGPASFEAWTQSWRVFRVTCISLGVVAEVALQKYYRHVEKLVRLWPECWGLIYLAEDKFRSDHLDRVRRHIEGDVARGITAPPLWDAAAPWSAAFLVGILESEHFWDDQVRHPAIAWMAGGKRGLPLAPTEEAARRTVRDFSPAKQPRKPNTWGEGRSNWADERRKKREGGSKRQYEEESHQQQAAKKQRTEEKGKGKKGGGTGKDKEPKYRTTSDGKPLCFSWNGKYGKCADVTGACPSGRVHACTTCRSPNHRAADGKCA